jgi:hypothetical protein
MRFQGRTETIFKGIVIGDLAFEKTSLLSKFSTNKFDERYVCYFSLVY